MLTDIVTNKGEAKKDIYGALIGLLVVLGAVLILYVINPNLTSVDVSLDRLGTEKAALQPDQVYDPDDYGFYLSLPTAADPQAIAALKQDCEATSNRFQLIGTSVLDFRGQFFSPTARCYILGPTGHSDSERICWGISCSPGDEADEKAACEGAVADGGKGGSFYIDPANTDWGYCVY